MKFVKLLKYIEKSLNDKPAFLILMSDQKEYISHGCQFVENTEKNRNHLITRYDCEEYLNELLNLTDEVDFSQIKNASCMFFNSKITEFDHDMSNVVNASYMFCNTYLKEFNSDMSNVTDASCMFYNTKIVIGD